jgi:CRP-like cAMP-binding protein
VIFAVSNVIASLVIILPLIEINFSNLHKRRREIMSTTTPFFEYLQKFVDIGEDEFLQFVNPYIVVRKYAKKQIITEQGNVENHFNFILKGLARKYYKKGKEQINTQISYEHHIIHSNESFHSRTPSEYVVEAIETTTVISITYDDLEKIYARSQRMEHLGRLIITHAMVLKDRWQIQLIMHTPRERFIYFVTRFPELLQRVPQKYLASYLNIKPETFSRFKHLVRNGGKTEVVEDFALSNGNTK